MGTRSMSKSVLEALLGQTRGALLALFFSHVEEAYYLRQVARLVDGGLGAVQRELQHLTVVGLLRREVRGRHVYYQANRDCPVFRELQGLVIKTAGVVEVLRAALASLAERATVAFVYGSFAKGSNKAGSDVDLILVGELTFGEVVAALAPVQDKLCREVNPIVYPPAEFQRKLVQGHHFLTRVLKEPKVFLLGGEHELARLAQERLADRAADQPT
jgi:predicted nucleotidyltransferase